MALKTLRRNARVTSRFVASDLRARPLLILLCRGFYLCVRTTTHRRVHIDPRETAVFNTRFSETTSPVLSCFSCAADTRTKSLRSRKLFVVFDCVPSSGFFAGKQQIDTIDRFAQYKSNIEKRSVLFPSSVHDTTASSNRGTRRSRFL